jgi:hypothetical protein
MRRSYLINRLAFVALLAVAFVSCKKENGIDNETVIKKPYGLYVGDHLGALLSTNDGDTFKTVFPKDGYPIRAITTINKNAIFIKANVHLSQDNGQNFNPTYFFANPIPVWQQMILTVPSHGRVYLSSIDFTTKGVVYSDDTGRTWHNDDQWDPGIAAGGITSFTQLKNGMLYAHALNSDSLYKRDNRDDKWTHVNPIPNIPGGGMLYISHFNDEIVGTGVNGVYHSTDGINWSQYNGLPATFYRCTSAPFEQALLVGTDSMGIYRLDGNTFVAANNGLETKTTVFAITAKENVYKNETSKKYVYIATDKGVYRSEDMGHNWIRVLPGRFVSAY